MISRRHLLRGLIATPAVVAIGSLMPLKGIKFDPLIRLQSWPIGMEMPEGEWWTHTGRASRSVFAEAEMKRQFGNCYWGTLPEAPFYPQARGFPKSKARFLTQGFPEFPQTAEEARAWVGTVPEERSQFGYIPPQERNEYGRKVGFRPDELQPVDTSAIHHIQDDRPQIPTEKLKAELARICQWGA